MECMKVEYTHTISVEDYSKLRKSAGWSYKLFGFDERPNEELGAGMTQWIYGEQTNETT
ncbi:hypothetical protein [Thermoclostridium caenicola]|uniref:Uncharacterized protein n=1 Tax=Thermoclostridium caenicola TaxID=659425 RepID=A0A1M6JCQ8_9FIRM|nr:hypothetical protein [Thermoclostridium caenicola]SHJ44489.1 hypothetical protein SAMN05444373_105514 [Thermoclostridium caenicola]